MLGIGNAMSEFKVENKEYTVGAKVQFDDINRHIEFGIQGSEDYNVEQFVELCRINSLFIIKTEFDIEPARNHYFETIIQFDNNCKCEILSTVDKVFYMFTKNGIYHRSDGPAKISTSKYRDDKFRWWIEGERLSIEKEKIMSLWYKARKQNHGRV